MPFGLPRVTGHDRFHRVQRGQNLMAIARHHGLALDHLSMANRLPAQLRVPVGRRLVIPGRRILPLHPPANGLVVNLPERVAYLFRSGRLAAFYPVAIGRPGFETPVGQFRIISRVKNPTWLPPEWAGKGEIVVPAGPDNPLGDRWIGLSAKGIGLHATTDVPSVGGNASHGCMRMYPRAAHQLFTLVKVGMPVRIEYETARMGWDPRASADRHRHFPGRLPQAGPGLRSQAPPAPGRPGRLRGFPANPEAGHPRDRRDPSRVVRRRRVAERPPRAPCHASRSHRQWAHVAALRSLEGSGPPVADVVGPQQHPGSTRSRCAGPPGDSARHPGLPGHPGPGSDERQG